MKYLTVLIGITPAHAGKSCFLAGFLILGTDHPRTRGEKVIKKGFVYPVRGSPPHTRGKAMPHGIVVGSFRITPAHAGKSVFFYAGLAKG